jgi:AcrR family transcriptional regulator
MKQSGKVTDVSESANVEVLPTSKRLLVSAASLFSEKGFAGTTTRELSDAIGVQKSSLYHHIDSKEALLFDLCKSTLADVSTVIRKALGLGGDAGEKLRRVLTDYTTLILTDRDRHTTMLVEIRSLSESHRKAVVRARDKNVREVRSVIEEAQRAGQMRSDITSKDLALGLFNLLNWSIFWYDDKGSKSPSEIASFLSRIYFEGVNGR